MFVTRSAGSGFNSASSQQPTANDLDVLDKVSGFVYVHLHGLIDYSLITGYIH